MSDVLNRATKQFIRSVNTPEYSVQDWIHNPDLSAVTGQPSKYWVISGDTVTLMDQASRDAVDAAELEAESDSIADEIDEMRGLTRALALAMLDEFNVVREKKYGGLYRDEAVTGQSVPNNVWKSFDALTDANAMPIGGGVVADTANGKITLPSAGDWLISWKLSFSGSDDSEFKFAAFGNNTRIPGTGASRDLGATSGIGSASGEGIVRIPAAGVGITLRCRHSEGAGAKTITVEQLQLVVQDVTDRPPRTIEQLKTAIRNKL